jgi:hypothetical protein
MHQGQSKVIEWNNVKDTFSHFHKNLFVHI